MGKAEEIKKEIFLVLLETAGTRSRLFQHADPPGML